MSMAGYSGTPLPRKLGIGEGSRVLFADAPDGFATTLGEAARVGGVVAAGEGAVDVAVLFARDAAALRAKFAGLAASLQPAGGPLGGLAEAQLGRLHGSRREPRPRDRPRRGAGGQQGLRHRRDLVGPALRMAFARSATASLSMLPKCKIRASLAMGRALHRVALGALLAALVPAGSAGAATPRAEVPGPGSTVRVDAAAGELEDGTIVVHGARGRLSVHLEPGSAPLLLESLAVLRLTTTRVAGREIGDPLPPLSRSRTSTWARR